MQTNLVSDIPRLATITDPQLVNPWGVSESATNPFWVSDQGTSNATLYSVTGATNVTKVNINPPNGFVAIPTTATGPHKGLLAKSRTATRLHSRSRTAAMGKRRASSSPT